MADRPDPQREHAVAEYFRWNADAFVRSVSIMATAAILLTFAMLDRLFDSGFGYGGRRLHLTLLALAGVCALPTAFRERHVMLLLRPVLAGTLTFCVVAPALLCRFVPPAPGARAHVPGAAITLAGVALVAAAAGLIAAGDTRWKAFLLYCRAPSVWDARRGHGRGE